MSIGEPGGSEEGGPDEISTAIGLGDCGEAEPERGAHVGGVEVEGARGVGGTTTTVGGAADGAGEGDTWGGAFFLPVRGLRMRRRPSRLPMAVSASPTSRAVPLIETARNPEVDADGETDTFACEMS